MAAPWKVGMRCRMRASGAWVLAATLPWACADPTRPFEPLDRVDESQQLPRQLTFSTADDRSPAWGGDGIEVLYATEGREPFADAPGLLLGLPAGGGAAEALLPELQFPGGPTPWFASPVAAPDDGRLAWVELWGVRPENLCPQTAIQCTPEGTDGVAPRLSELRVRVRTPGTGDPSTDPFLRVPLQGVEELPPSGITSFEVHEYPFQRIYNAERSAVFRPSWSPDGQRIAFSDGLRILVWTPGGGAPEPVSGTEDGVQVAWSPDGSWLAYTRLVRGAPESYTCDHLTLFGPACEQIRTEYPVTARVVTLVRPDGSETVDVGPGDDPAWMPDSNRLVVRREGSLWIVGRDGSGATQVSGTEGGREPAVSPDGGTLAFSRLDATLTAHDVWLVSLGGGL